MAKMRAARIVITRWVSEDDDHVDVQVHGMTKADLLPYVEALGLVGIATQEIHDRYREAIEYE